MYNNDPKKIKQKIFWFLCLICKSWSQENVTDIDIGIEKDVDQKLNRV